MSNVQESSEVTVRTAEDFIGPVELELLEFLFDNLPHYRTDVGRGSRETIQEILASSPFNVIRFEDRLYFGGFTTMVDGKPRPSAVVVISDSANKEIVVTTVEVASLRSFNTIKHSDVQASENLQFWLKGLATNPEFQNIREAFANRLDLDKFRQLWAVRDQLPRYFSHQHDAENWMCIYLGLSIEHNVYLRVKHKPGFSFGGAELITEFAPADGDERIWKPLSLGLPGYHKAAAEQYNALYKTIDKVLNAQSRL